MSFQSIPAWGRMFLVGSGVAVSGAVALHVVPYGQEMRRVMNDERWCSVREREASQDYCAALLASGNETIASSVLTPKIVTNLSNTKSQNGAILSDLLKPTEAGDKIGIYAPDKSSYTCYKDLFNPVIERVQGTKITSQPREDFGVSKLEELPAAGSLDPSKNYVLGTKITVARNIYGYSFLPIMRKDDLLITEQWFKQDIEDHKEKYQATLGNSLLCGNYYSYSEIKGDLKQKLVDNNLHFDATDPGVRAAKGYEHWPKGRGLYVNKNCNFAVWLNQEDNLKFISQRSDDGVRESMESLIRGMHLVGDSNVGVIKLKRDSKLGELTFSPANVGSGLHLHVRMRLPKISGHKEFHDKLSELGLKASPVPDNKKGSWQLYEVTNKQTLGLSEFEIVKQTSEAIQKLIEMDKKM